MDAVTLDGVDFSKATIHCLPDNDEREHSLDPRRCWCKPWPELVLEGPPKQVALWSHKASDCREAAEIVTGEGLAPEKTWTLKPVEGRWLYDDQDQIYYAPPL